MKPADICILFDLDGTIMRIPDGTGFSSFEEAFYTVFPNLDKMTITIMPQTDFELLSSLIPPNVPDNIINSFYMSYSKILQNKLNLCRPILCPNVYNALVDLTRAGVEIAVFTGNAHLPAEIKLRSVGIDHFFKFGFYGDFSKRKVDILLNYDVQNLFCEKKTLIVGDSVSDILAAQKMNIPILAVSTGWTSYDELFQYYPNAILNELPDNLPSLYTIIESIFHDSVIP